MEEAELPVPDFKLPPARELDADDREGLMRKAIARIREGAKELVATESAYDASDPHHLKTTPADMWMLLLVRMITRVSDPSVETEENDVEMKAADAVAKRSEIYDRQDRLRHALCEYIMTDFSGR